MRSHLQFGAVLDNAVIRLEMQKSSLKLNNIFVTVLRGADCLEPCWSLDLEYFGGVLAVESVKVTPERPEGGDFGTRLQALAFPLASFGAGSFSLPSPKGTVLPAPGGGTGGRISPMLGDVGATGGRSRGPCLAPHGHGSTLLSPPVSLVASRLAVRIRLSFGEKAPSHLLSAFCCQMCKELPWFHGVWGDFSSCCPLTGSGRRWIPLSTPAPCWKTG